MDLVEIVAERTGMSQERAKIYVEMAKQRALAHTNRTVYITAMDFCVADLACAMYFREGMVGEASHLLFSLPPMKIFSQLSTT